GIRDPLVTGVQTCALPISPATLRTSSALVASDRGKGQVKKVLVVLLLIVAGVGAFLYFPRGGATTSASNAATLAILNTAIEGARAGSAFAPALDGEVYATGDLVRPNAVRMAGPPLFA